jgi:hypothetical protein
MERIDPRTPEGMRELTLRSAEFCRLRLETSGNFDQHFGLFIGGTTEEFALSKWAATSSLSRIFEEAHKEARRAHAEALCLMLRRPMAAMNGRCTIEVWDSVFVVAQTETRTATAMLPFRAADSGLQFGELQLGECESESFATPEVIFRKLGYVADAAMLDDTTKGRGPEAMWN